MASNQVPPINTGDRFGHWTVLDPVPTKDKRQYRILCECVCGKQKRVRRDGLRSGQTTNCGCVSDKETAKKNMRYFTQGARGLSILYKQYKASAVTRDLSFELSLDEFEKLTSADCYYCGVPPSNKVIPRGHASEEIRQFSTYTYSGIDRVDNDLGYVITNCLPCCKPCNVAKNNHTAHDFIERAHRISARHKTRISEVG